MALCLASIDRSECVAERNEAVPARFVVGFRIACCDIPRREVANNASVAHMHIAVDMKIAMDIEIAVPAAVHAVAVMEQADSGRGRGVVVEAVEDDSNVASGVCRDCLFLFLGLGP